MTTVTTYISFDGNEFFREDLCLKHEREVIERGVFFFDCYGNPIEVSQKHFENEARLIYIMIGAEKSFADLGYRNWVGGYAINMTPGWYVRNKDDNGWTKVDDVVYMIGKAKTYVENEIDQLEDEIMEKQNENNRTRKRN